MKAPEKLYFFNNEPILKERSEKRQDSNIEYTRTDSFIEKAKKAFCKATCNGHPPRRTCTSLGTCKEYDEFIKMMKGK